MFFILQVDFPFQGPWGQEMTEAMKDLATSIATEKGLIWKIWTEDKTTQNAGGIYLFESREDAQVYLSMHSLRLSAAGIKRETINGKIFEVNEPLSLIDRAPLK